MEDIELRRLVIKAFHMDDVEFGDENKITTGGKMTITKNGLDALAAKHSEVIEKIDIQIKNTHVLNGLAKDLVKECAAYERQIKAAGGIDLQVLGIGSDGHIAFNEPGTSLKSRTSCVYLTPSTIKDNARLFFKGKEKEVPTRALSMGVGTICEARKIVLLAFGEGKQNAIKGCVEGPMTQFCTASALQAHNDCWIFCDEAAAKKLTLKKYYAWRSATKLGL